MTVMAELMVAMTCLRSMVAEIENAATEGEARIAQIAAFQHLETITKKCEARKPHAAIARRLLARAESVLVAASLFGQEDDALTLEQRG